MSTPAAGPLHFLSDGNTGQLYVEVISLVEWLHGYASGLKAEGRDAEANAVAAVGITMAEQLDVTT